MRAFLPAVLWFIFIFIISTMPGSYFPKFSWSDLFSFDKIVHMTVYGILTMLTLRGFRIIKKPSSIPVFIIWAVTLGACAYGASLEWIQGNFFIKNHRTFDTMDMIANNIGAFISGLIFYVIQRRRQSQTA